MNVTRTKDERNAQIQQSTKHLNYLITSLHVDSFAQGRWVHIDNGIKL